MRGARVVWAEGESRLVTTRDLRDACHSLVMWELLLMKADHCDTSTMLSVFQQFIDDSNAVYHDAVDLELADTEW